MPDVSVENHGSIMLVQPHTPGADTWLRENTDGQWYSGALVVEPRYIDTLIDGMESNGLTVALGRML